MTLADYLTFTTIAECKSLTLAGKNLHLTKSAISHAVARMEAEFGFPLFHRDSKRFSLTENAQQLLPYAYSILRENTRFMEQVHQIQGLASGCITIGTCSSICINWIPAITNGFRELYPDIEVRVKVSASNNHIATWLLNNEIDIGLAPNSELPNLDIFNIYDDELICVTKPTFISKNPPYIDIEELDGMPVILQTDDFVEEPLRVFHRLGINPTAYFTTYDDASLVAMVEGGLGYCIVGKLILKSLSASVNSFSFNPPQYRQLALLRNSRSKPSPLVQMMIDHILAYVKEQSNDFNPYLQDLTPAQIHKFTRKHDNQV